MNQWKSARESVISSAFYKVKPTDFKVTETLPFELYGEGEHLFLYVKKIGANTHFVAKQLADFFKVKERDIGYAGLKDRHAETHQWFSVHLPGIKEVPELPSHPEFKVIDSGLHNKKLKTGAIKANLFELCIRNIEGDKKAIENRLDEIFAEGVPNYFGEQRFGRDQNNLVQARKMLEGKRVKKHQRSIYLSAIRSWFFNQYLAERITKNSWLTPQEHDHMALSGSRSFFKFEPSELDDIVKRLKEQDIHIAAPMPGNDFQSEYPELFAKMQESWSKHIDVLDKVDAKTDWRSMRVIPSHSAWQWQQSEGELSLLVSFELPSGAYATQVLQELGNVQDGSQGVSHGVVL